MLTCHVDGQGYVEKHFSGCVALSLKQKIKFLPATLRILKCLDKLRSNFRKLVNLRLNTITFWNPGFMTFNLKIIFQNCWHNNLTNSLFCQFNVNMYYQFTDSSQPHLFDIMCEGLPTEKTCMLEQGETSKLKLLLTNNGCAHFGASKRLLFILSVVLCLPTIWQYDIRSKRIIVWEVL